MSLPQQRDSGLHHFSDVEAGVQDYVNCVVGGMAVEIQLPSGTTVYAKEGFQKAVQVICFGSGGGYCWERQWPRSELTTYLRSVIQHDPELRRGPTDEVWPEGWS